MARTRLAAGAARRLVSRFGLTRPPIEVEDVALKLGIEVVREEFPDNISGALLRSGKETVIAVNKGHHINRQRFSIAHELGHYLLHPDSAAYYDQKHDIGVHFRAKTDRTTWDPREVEANRFAAELLMPRRIIKDAIAQTGEVQASELARQFGVSEEAMTHRLAGIRL
jgi:Zn-dependent peptidase ImmA (M78 family)